MKQIPESIVRPPERGARDNSFLGQVAAVGANTDIAEMILDLKAMLQASWTTKRILEHWKPDHPKEFRKAVEHLREQMLAEQGRARAAAKERG